MIPWTVQRMMVEAHAKTDAMDMTWVRFRSVRDSLDLYRRLTDGKGITHEDHIRLQKECAVPEL